MYINISSGEYYREIASLKNANLALGAMLESKDTELKAKDKELETKDRELEAKDKDFEQRIQKLERFLKNQ